jgi:glycosyltransferase involved in cell wall biosynthesis
VSVRVGFDARLLHHTGIGRYCKNLLARLAGPGWVVWVSSADKSAAQDAWPDAEVRVCPARPFSVAEQVFWARELPQAPIDLFHAPHLNVPLVCPVPLVVTLHDLIPLHFPRTINSRAGALYFAAMSRLAVRRARLVIAVSQHTANDLVLTLGAERTRVRVVLQGADRQFSVPVPEQMARDLRSRLALTGRYILYAGQWKRYKNLETLIAAFAALGPAHADVKLVLLGRIDPRATHVLSTIARYNLGTRIVLPGYLIDEQEVVALFQGASVFAFPSRYEGFGLPPLEAMAAGVPVVSSNATALPEVVAEAALLVTPDDVPGWTRALGRALSEPLLRAELVQAGHERVKWLDWERTAEATRAVYAELANQGGP